MKLATQRPDFAAGACGRSWPLATEVDVSFHVGDWGMSRLVVLSLSFVADDPNRKSGAFASQNMRCHKTYTVRHIESGSVEPYSPNAILCDL